MHPSFVHTQAVPAASTALPFLPTLYHACVHTACTHTGCASSSTCNAPRTTLPRSPWYIPRTSTPALPCRANISRHAPAAGTAVAIAAAAAAAAGAAAAAAAGDELAVKANGEWGVRAQQMVCV